MTKLMAVFAVWGATEGTTQSHKVQVEIDPGELYEQREKCLRNAEDKCSQGLGLDVLFATYFEGVVEVEE